MQSVLCRVLKWHICTECRDVLMVVDRMLVWEAGLSPRCVLWSCKYPCLRQGLWIPNPTLPPTNHDLGKFILALKFPEIPSL